VPKDVIAISGRFSEVAHMADSSSISRAGASRSPIKYFEQYFPPVQIFVFLFWAVFVATIAVNYGSDASWDLRNYHLYGPHALLHGRLGRDIAPAHFQGYFPPTMDIPSYVLRSSLNDHPALLAALLSLPQAIGAYFATLIARRFIPVCCPWRWPIAIAIAMLGATGAASLSTIASVQSEMIPGCLILAGFLVLIGQTGLRLSPASLIASGFLFGAALGLKLTSAPSCLGIVTATMLAGGGTIASRLTSVGLLVAGVALGACLLGGWWWLYLYSTYGNPIFPLYNNIFHSPFVGPAALTDERFKPADLLQLVFYPFYWGITWRSPVAEVAMRDPRLMFAYVACAALALQRVLRSRFIAGATLQERNPEDAKIGFLLIFFTVSYAAWELWFSILRYLAPIEMLSGTVIALPLLALAKTRRHLAVAASACAVIAVLCLRMTTYPEWGHAPFSSRAVAVEMPHIEPNSLIILLDPSPMAYLAAFVPDSSVVVGANNSLLHPGDEGLLQQQAQRLIGTYKGPLYGLETPSVAPGVADRTLADYQLHRQAGCTHVRSNLDKDGVLFCVLGRDNESMRVSSDRTGNKTSR
jgi:hypothetical protein